MQQRQNFNLIVGMCRCDEHAQRYEPRDKPKGSNQSKVYYFVDPTLVPSNLLCGACLQKGEIRHGGIIISQESYTQGLVAFRAHAGYQLTGKEIQTAKQIWPRK